MGATAMADFDKGNISDIKDMLSEHFEKITKPLIESGHARLQGAVGRVDAKIEAVEGKVDTVSDQFSDFMKQRQWQQERDNKDNLQKKEAAEARDKQTNWNGTKLTILIAIAGLILTLLIALGLIPKLRGQAGVVSMDKQSEHAQNGSQHAVEPDSNVGSN